jgi:hypothetical protein
VSGALVSGSDLYSREDAYLSPDCDVISAMTEFMVSVVAREDALRYHDCWLEVRHVCDPNTCRVACLCCLSVVIFRINLVQPPEGVRVNAEFVVSSSEDDTIRVWRRDSGECTVTLQHHGSMEFVLHPSSILVTASNGALTAWDLYAKGAVLGFTFQCGARFYFSM